AWADAALNIAAPAVAPTIPSTSTERRSRLVLSDFTFVMIVGPFMDGRSSPFGCRARLAARPVELVPLWDDGLVPARTFRVGAGTRHTRAACGSVRWCRRRMREGC